MVKDVKAQFDDPRTVAAYLGETVGVHYSAALRAVEAYGKHLASVRAFLLNETFEGEGLRNFWKDLLDSEQVRIKSPEVLRRLSTETSHYFFDFLETADEIYGKRYQDVPPAQKKKLGHSQHAQCIRIMRDHDAEGIKDRFALQNRIATWKQMIKVMGGYRE
jgi:hypothetical protein